MITVSECIRLEMARVIKLRLTNSGKLSRITGYCQSHCWKVLNGASVPTLEFVESMEKAGLINPGKVFEEELKKRSVSEFMKKAGFVVPQLKQWEEYED